LDRISRSQNRPARTCRCAIRTRAWWRKPPKEAEAIRAEAIAKEKAAQDAREQAAKEAFDKQREEEERRKAEVRKQIEAKAKNVDASGL
jgi:hypothetical protein